MLEKAQRPAFQRLNRGYGAVFRPNRLSLGLVAPLEAYPSGPTPTMARHLERVELAEHPGPEGEVRVRLRPPAGNRVSIGRFVRALRALGEEREGWIVSVHRRA